MAYNNIINLAKLPDWADCALHQRMRLHSLEYLLRFELELQ